MPMAGSQPEPPRLRVERDATHPDSLCISLTAPDERVETLFAELQSALRQPPSRDRVTIAIRFAGTFVPALRHLLNGAVLEFQAKDLEEEVERRIREVEGHRCPRGEPHTLVDEDGLLLVYCHFEDREQAKRIPGYRWDPERRAWVYPSSRLHRVMAEVAYRAGADEPPAPRPTSYPAPRPPQAPAPAFTTADADAAVRRALDSVVEANRKAQEQLEEFGRTLARLVERIELIERRLVDGLDGLQRGFESLKFATAAEASPVAAAAAPAPIAPRRPEDLLDLCRSAPRDALREIERQLALEPSPAWRAVEAIAAANAGDWRRAVRWLEATSGAALPKQLREERAVVLRRAVAAVIGAAISTDTADPEAVAAAFAAILESGGLSDEQRLNLAEASEPTRWAWIRAEAPQLEELRRLTAALAALPAAGSEPLGALLDILRTADAPQHRRAALLGAACALAGVPSLTALDAWWPGSPAARRTDLGALAGSLAEFVRALPEGARASAALAALALLAPLDEVPMQVRRDLLRAVPEGDRRPLAEFLAVFRPAVASEHPPNPEHYPGLARELVRRLQSRTVPAEAVDSYLQEVALQGTSQWQRALADGGVLEARVEAYGLPDGDALDTLIELARAVPNGEGLNRLARLVEDTPDSGTPDTRERLFEAAFEASSKSRNQARDAFLRLLRHAQAHWEQERRRGWIAQQCGSGHSHTRILASIEYATEMLEALDSADDVAAALEPLRANLEGQQSKLDLSLAGEVLLLFSELRERFGEDVRLPELPLPEAEAPAEAPALRPLRLLIVGGHQRLRRHALPRLEARGHQVQWLGPDEAVTGSQLPQAAAGACDYVLVITPYISHAAAERARSAAGDRCVLVSENGVMGLLRRVDRLAADV